jgi:general secretion pathway protein A
MSPIKRSRLSLESLARLGLKELPFRVSADPRFLYLTSAIANLIDRLLDLITYEEGLAVVEGKIGTGKTSVARRLFEIANGDDNNYHPVYMHTASFSTALEAAKDISKHFGVSPRRAYTDQLRDFESYLIQVRQDDLIPVLMIDDAQLMSPTSLDAIQNMLNFDISVKLIQIILFGQPEIHSNFGNSPAVLDRVVSWQNLGAMNFRDTVAMLNWRVQQAGRVESLFDNEALQFAFDQSEGTPRTIILLANDALRELVLQNGQIITGAIMKKAIKRYKQRPSLGDKNDQA